MVEPDQRVRIAPDVAWVDLDDRVTVVRLSDPAGDPLVLAGSAAEVWRAVGDGATPRDVVVAVAASYGVGTAVVEADVLALLDEATRSGILTGPPGRSQMVDLTSTE